MSAVSSSEYGGLGLDRHTLKFAQCRESFFENFSVARNGEDFRLHDRGRRNSNVVDNPAQLLFAACLLRHLTTLYFSYNVLYACCKEQ